MNLIIPKDYNPVLDLRDTEIAIKLVKDFFEQELAKALNLTRVSAPIMVTPESGLNAPFPSTCWKQAPPWRLCTPWPNGSVRPSKPTAFPWVKAFIQI